ncbi:type II secretion system protein N [Marinobacter confluentis]|uniref:General secretion pathway protein GspC n=1 Tax=Marinobacter confluentis TaxID=1697557 RepID=A0A4Z1C3E3_9GAMM|nr:type II secretion system protein N [Marinobacter confluentis]TGN41728.1 general secretion pathway protein GspC [Marinobacter confluentis]
MLSMSPRLPLILSLVAALGMVSATAWQAYGFWQHETSASGIDSKAAVTADQQPQQQEPDISLETLAMFGDADQPQAAPEEDMENLPETNLRLVLRGVMSASGDFPGSALVEDSKSQTEAYIVGDELSGDAILRAVRPDRIIIERAGVLESLYFPEDEDRSGFAFAANDSSDDNGSQPDYAEQQARSASFPGPEVNRSSDSRREEIRQRLEQLRNRLRNNN